MHMSEKEHAVEMYNARENLRTHLNDIGSRVSVFEIDNVSLIGDSFNFSVNVYAKAVPVGEIENENYEVKTVIASDAKDVNVFEVKITTPLSDK